MLSPLSVLKGEFQKFKHEFLLKANMLDISGHFVGQGTRVVRVGDPLKQRAVLLRKGFSSEEIGGAYQAWNFIDGAVQSEADRSIQRRCKSPREAFDHLEKWYVGGVAPSATRNARGASGRTWSRDRGGVEGNPPTPSVSPRRADFVGINGSDSRCSSDESRTSSDSSNSNDSGDLPALVGRPARDLEVFGELPALQSGRTMSQSGGLTMSASYAYALLAYTMRTVEAKKIMEEKASPIERARDSLLEERLEKERQWFEELERRDALLD